MFVGHYGISFLAKGAEKSIPLWVLFIAVQLVDILWAIFVFVGIEKVRIVPGITATNPLDLYYMPYTHSLLGAFLWAVFAFLLYKFARKSAMRAAVLVGAAVFSHWLLDLIVHIPDLSLYDDTYKMGLGLWNYPAAAFASEAVLLFAGIYFYLRRTAATSVIGKIGMPIFGIVLLVFQTIVFLPRLRNHLRQRQ
jgi:membrane-bound metal-dependent hydrolase YbcI (DUF457 family)